MLIIPWLAFSFNGVHTPNTIYPYMHTLHFTAVCYNALWSPATK